MPFIPALNTAKCTVKQLLFNQIITNNFYVRNSVAWTEATMTDLANLINTAWNAHVGPVQTTECLYVSTLVRDMTAETGLGVEIGFPSLSGGDRLSGAAPGNVAVACKLITNFSGRNFRGRLFIGGIDEEVLDGNAINAIYHAQLETNMRSFVQDVNAGAGEVVVASFYDGMALQENGRGETVWTAQPRATATLTPVTNVVVDKFTDSMRSRLQGRGN